MGCEAGGKRKWHKWLSLSFQPCPLPPQNTYGTPSSLSSLSPPLRAAASSLAILSFRAFMSAAFSSSLTPHMPWCHYILSLSNVILPSFSRLTVVLSNISNNASLNEERGIEVSMNENFSCLILLISSRAASSRRNLPATVSPSRISESQNEEGNLEFWYGSTNAIISQTPNPRNPRATILGNIDNPPANGRQLPVAAARRQVFSLLQGAATLLFFDY